MTRSLLGILTDHVGTIAEAATNRSSVAPSSSSSTTPSVAVILSRQCTLWIWAVLARLEKPLHAEIGHILCSLYRHLAIIRASHREVNQFLILFSLPLLNAFGCL
jgi:hypothetical protein